MGMKKKLGMGVASLALGLSLVGGGTYAYFSSDETVDGTFTAGTLDLAVKVDETSTKAIAWDNMKPGDTLERTFNINKGSDSEDISELVLNISDSIKNGDGDAQDLDKHILVKVDGYGTYKLANIIDNHSGLDLIKEGVLDKNKINGDDSEQLKVTFEFKDDGNDQSEFQGANLDLDLNFEARTSAADGESK